MFPNFFLIFQIGLMVDTRSAFSLSICKSIIPEPTITTTFNSERSGLGYGPNIAYLEVNLLSLYKSNIGDN